MKRTILLYLCALALVLPWSMGCISTATISSKCESHSDCMENELCRNERCEAFDALCSDADRDGICDVDDRCADGDDGLDSDRDGIADACDICPTDALNDSDSDLVCDSIDRCLKGDDNQDSDGDGVPDACDLCEGSDDRIDMDNDGIPDACDPCPDSPSPDSDGDGVCDFDDECPGHDDSIDTDGDSIADGCDPCPNDAAGDSDADGVCDSDDKCEGHDDALDEDSDGVPDGCDPCPADTVNDTDGDGVCDSVDRCPGHNDVADVDSDTVPDGCDICPGGSDLDDSDGDLIPDHCDVCPFDRYNDSDNDGVCFFDDICKVGDDNQDEDGDSIPDACDPCPNQNPNNIDACGVCGGPGPATWYEDSDGDGMGDSASSLQACTQPAGYMSTEGDPHPDCQSNLVFCGVCDGPAMPVWYGDSDNDGQGDPADAVQGCDPPTDRGYTYVANNLDPCPDHNPNGNACGICNFVNDVDQDGVCNGADVCSGFDDNADEDNDGTPDGCDDGYTLLKEDVQAGGISWNSSAGLDPGSAGRSWNPVQFQIGTASFPDNSNTAFSFAYPPTDANAGNFIANSQQPGYARLSTGDVALATTNSNSSRDKFVVKFSHWFDFDSMDSACYGQGPSGLSAAGDGGLVEIQHSGQWTQVTPLGGYSDQAADVDDTFTDSNSSTCQPYGALPFFSQKRGAQSERVETVVDISAYEGSSIQVGFRTIWDCSNCFWKDSSAATPSGWHVDDIEVLRTQCGNSRIEAGEACDDGNNADDDACSANCDYQSILPRHGAQTSPSSVQQCPTGSVAVGLGIDSEGMCLVCRSFDSVTLGDSEQRINQDGQSSCATQTPFDCYNNGGGVLVGMQTAVDDQGSIRKYAAICQSISDAAVSSVFDSYTRGDSFDASDSPKIDRCVGGSVVSGFKFYGGSGEGAGAELHCGLACPSGDFGSCGVCGGSGELLWYPDTDSDGFREGDVAEAVFACTAEAPSGYLPETSPVDPCLNDIDNDSDNDGHCLAQDNCPTISNSNQANNDGDSEGDVCDNDDDNDGVPDSSDAFPFDASETTDSDGDGIGDNADPDDDNDGVSDVCELPLERVRQLFETGTYTGRSGSVGSCTGCHTDTSSSTPSYSIMRASGSLYNYVNIDYMPASGTKWNAGDKAILQSWIDCGRPW